MIKLTRYLLFILLLCIAFAGCSKTNNIDTTTSGTRDKSVVESSENKVAVIPINEIPPLKEGTRVKINWAFPYIRYDGRLYQIKLDTTVGKGKVGREIGKVKRFISSSIVISDKSFIDKDGDSNYLTEGSLIYAFKGKDIKEAIIIDNKGEFKKAILFDN